MIEKPTNRIDEVNRELASIEKRLADARDAIAIANHPTIINALEGLLDLLKESRGNLEQERSRLK